MRRAAKGTHRFVGCQSRPIRQDASSRTGKNYLKRRNEKDTRTPSENSASRSKNTRPAPLARQGAPPRVVRGHARVAEGAVSAPTAPASASCASKARKKPCSCRRRRWPASCTAIACASSVERGRDGRYSGRLEKILEHATKAFVGTLEVHGRTAFVTSADRRIGMRCLVPPEELGGARHGDWVIAAVTRYAGSGAIAAGAQSSSVSIPKSRSNSPAKRPSRASTCRANFRPRPSAKRKLRQRSRPGRSVAARGPARTCRW